MKKKKVEKEFVSAERSFEIGKSNRKYLAKVNSEVDNQR